MYSWEKGERDKMVWAQTVQRVKSTALLLKTAKQLPTNHGVIKAKKCSPSNIPLLGCLPF